MLLLHVAKDDDIIQVDHTVCEVQLPQGVLHETLEHRGCITQPEWHAGKLVEPEVTHCKAMYCCDSRAILICQKPDLKSIDEKCADPAMLSNASWMQGKGYKSFFIHTLRHLKSTQKCRVLSFFWTKTTA